MKFNLLAILVFTFLISCGSKINIPSKEESLAVIKKNKEQIQDSDSKIDKQNTEAPSKDLTIKIRTEGLNKVLDKIAFKKTKDFNIDLLSTPNIFIEEKSALGIKYTNSVSLEKGNIGLDLKKFRLFSSNSGFKGNLELEANGEVKVSGRYMGLPASVSPSIQMYLDENFDFILAFKDTTLLLTPKPKTMVLKTKIGIKLMEWSIPYYKEIPLELSKLIKPIELPLTTESLINFPLPATKAGASKIEMVPLKVKLSNTEVNSLSNIFEIKSNLNFSR
jgi:hypothetical protein